MKFLKYLKSLLILLIIFVLSFIVTSNSKVKVVVIDAGHGGIDSGATRDNVNESSINLSIALKLQNFLENSGIKVYMTRTSDVTLAKGEYHKRNDIVERINYINSVSCDCYVSIHQNIFSLETYRGCQVFYSTLNTDSSVLALSVQTNMSNILKNSNRSIKEDSKIYLLNHLSKVGILIECGFMSNNEEFKLLTNDAYQGKVAMAISYGILDYLKI